jgi:mono/diheme cytochrome c family protein
LARNVHPHLDYERLGVERARREGRNKPMTYFRWKQVQWGCMLMVLCGLGAAQINGSGSAAKREPRGFSAQVKRGHDEYVENCAVCHNADLTGLDPAPALTAINAGAAELKSDPKALKSVVIRKPGGKQEAAATPAPSM